MGTIGVMNTPNGVFWRLPEDMLIDLHTHTTVGSLDSWLSPEELVERAITAGLDGICLTDHDWFWGEEELARLRGRYDFPIFSGVEITTEEAHFLVFGLSRYVFGMHRASFLRQVVDDASAVMILAHPHRRNLTRDDIGEAAFSRALERACRYPAFGLADAIEVLNGKCDSREMRFSLEMSRRLNLKGTGGSDAHSLTVIGSYATRFEKSIKSLPELVEELKAGRYCAENLNWQQKALTDRASPPKMENREA